MLNLFLSMPVDLKTAVGCMMIAVLYILFVWFKGFFNRPVHVNKQKVGQTYRKNFATNENAKGATWTADEAKKHWSNY